MTTSASCGLQPIGMKRRSCGSGQLPACLFCVCAPVVAFVVVVGGGGLIFVAAAEQKLRKSSAVFVSDVFVVRAVRVEASIF